MLTGRSLFAARPSPTSSPAIVTRRAGLEPAAGGDAGGACGGCSRAVSRSDPKRRLRDIGEARIGLERIAARMTPLDWRHPAQAAARGAPGRRAGRRPRRRGGVRRRMVLRERAARSPLPCASKRRCRPASPSLSTPTTCVAISRDGSRVAIVGPATASPDLHADAARVRSPPAARHAKARSGRSSRPTAPGSVSSHRVAQETRSSGGLVGHDRRRRNVRGAVWTETDTIIYPANGTTGLSSCLPPAVSRVA